MNRRILLLGAIAFLLTGCVAHQVYDFPVKRPATGRRVFVFDPQHYAWAAYDENGERVSHGQATGGRLYCPDIGRPCRTISGTFHIMAKGDADCKSGKYPIETNGGAPMPYCMLFSPKGYSIHGTNSSIPRAHTSHGCIGVTTSAAEWLNLHFLQIGSTVIVRPYS